jgi:hypothetical protein
LFRDIYTEEQADAFEKTCHLIASHVDDIDPSFFARGFFYSLGFDPSTHLYYKMVDQWIGKKECERPFLRVEDFPNTNGPKSVTSVQPSRPETLEAGYSAFPKLGFRSSYNLPL